MANALPLLVAGGAALFLLSGKKKRKGSGGSASSSYGGSAVSPYGEPGKGSPVPAPQPSKPEAKKQEDLLDPLTVENLLNDIGYPPGAIDGAYDQDTATAVMAFQMDWNAMMRWLWKHNDKISKTTPKYGTIGEDGAWGPQTESRAIRAYDTVGVGGDAYVTLNGEDIPVESFRDMVLKSYEAKPA